MTKERSQGGRGEYRSNGNPIRLIGNGNKVSGKNEFFDTLELIKHNYIDAHTCICMYSLPKQNSPPKN